VSPAPAPTVVAAPAPPSPPPGELKTEDVFEERVVTPSKTAQSPLDSPNSTSIITAQDIRLSGITKIPELLRRLAGVDIMETTGGQTEVSLRGFNQRFSNKVLVLVNGRSVFVDLIGATLWATLSIGVEDIERIEVVRGPASSVYGADAFNGVVNIITKPPGEGRSGVNVGYGDHNAAHGSVWATGRELDVAYRISAGYDYQPRWSREVPPDRPDVISFTTDPEAGQRSARLDVSVTRRLPKDIVIGLQGGYSAATFNVLAVGIVQDFIISPQTTDLLAFLSSQHFDLRVYWNRFLGSHGNGAGYIGQTLLPGEYDIQVVDSEAQYIASFETGAGINHDLRLGLGYRHKGIDWTYQDANRTEDHYAAYLHDEVKLGSSVALVGDYRLDWVPYLGSFVQSPRGSLLVHPNQGSTIRAAVGTAFRTPTFLESYLGLPTQLPISGGALVAQGLPTAQPGFRLHPEQVFTAEVGYLNAQSDYVTLDTAAFFNRVTNLIELSPIEAITLGDLADPRQPTGPSPSTGLYPIFLNQYENQCQIYNVYGAELGVRTFPLEGLDVYGNYTLMRVAEDDSKCSVERLAVLATDARTSAHKVNLGVQVRTRTGLDGEVDVHYVSPQDWAEQVTNVQKQRIEYDTYHLDAYAMLNARIGFRFLRDRAEISGVGFNLLDTRHREHPFGQVIGRRLMAYFTYLF
jgi:iron complex outermembrane receptor protein